MTLAEMILLCGQQKLGNKLHKTQRAVAYWGIRGFPKIQGAPLEKYAQAIVDGLASRNIYITVAQVLEQSKIARESHNRGKNNGST